METAAVEAVERAIASAPGVVGVVLVVRMFVGYLKDHSQYIRENTKVLSEIHATIRERR